VVGTTRNSIDCKMNVTPLVSWARHLRTEHPSKEQGRGEGKRAYLVPRSMARVSPPVCRDRWNLRSRLSRCSNVWRATVRTARWPTLANTAFNSSPNSVAPTRAPPSTLPQTHSSVSQSANRADNQPTKQPKQHVHARITDPQTTQTVEVECASTGMFSASMTSLKNRGT